MKFGFLILPVLFCLESASAQELKFNTATSQTTYMGAAPISTVRYELHFKKSKKQNVVIDSVKSIGDGRILPFSLNKKITEKEYKNCSENKILSNEKGVYRIAFTTTNILSEERLPYTEDNRPIQYDLSKGICVYYSQGGKRTETSVQTFKELPKIIQP